MKNEGTSAIGIGNDAPTACLNVCYRCNREVTFGHAQMDIEGIWRILCAPCVYEIAYNEVNNE